jgi:hypothetical protein
MSNSPYVRIENPQIITSEAPPIAQGIRIDTANVEVASSQQRYHHPQNQRRVPRSPIPPILIMMPTLEEVA